jgi:hypothetical protein
MLGGVDGSLHLTVPSMNRLNQAEPATFSILPCWAFFGDLYLMAFPSKILYIYSICIVILIEECQQFHEFVFVEKSAK